MQAHVAALQAERGAFKGEVGRCGGRTRRVRKGGRRFAAGVPLPSLCARWSYLYLSFPPSSPSLVT